MFAWHWLKKDLSASTFSIFYTHAITLVDVNAMCMHDVSVHHWKYVAKKIPRHKLNILPPHKNGRSKYPYQHQQRRRRRQRSFNIFFCYQNKVLSVKMLYCHSICRAYLYADVGLCSSAKTDNAPATTHKWYFWDRSRKKNFSNCIKLRLGTSFFFVVRKSALFSHNGCDGGSHNGCAFRKNGTKTLKMLKSTHASTPSSIHPTIPKHPWIMKLNFVFGSRLWTTKRKKKNKFLFYFLFFRRIFFIKFIWSPRKMYL